MELYDISADPGERRDLASANGARRDELLGDLLAWLKAIEAPLPAVRQPVPHVPAARAGQASR